MNIYFNEKQKVTGVDASHCEFYIDNKNTKIYYLSLADQIIFLKDGFFICYATKVIFEEPIICC